MGEEQKWGKKWRKVKEERDGGHRPQEERQLKLFSLFSLRDHSSELARWLLNQNGRELLLALQKKKISSSAPRLRKHRTEIIPSSSQ
ncbi:hypothetical protein GBA52_025108 [Prunus armeniaca]|nr:hypothetical protein GBA52_025108 [Prunus armeniaca]